MSSYRFMYLGELKKGFSEVVKKVPVTFLVKAYGGLHDLDLDLAVKKVGETK